MMPRKPARGWISGVAVLTSTAGAGSGCGVSCTGWGEYFIRNAVAHDVAARVAYLQVGVQAAAAQVIHGTLEEQRPGLGGLVALDTDGTVVMEFSTAGMYRGWVDQDGTKVAAIY